MVPENFEFFEKFPEKMQKKCEKLRYLLMGRLRGFCGWNNQARYRIVQKHFSKFILKFQNNPTKISD